jgi:pimeloyl-ACP methyl ester carboxylesterase
MTVETRYVTSGEVFVAYQISGQSGPDLLVAPGFVSHLEQMWENPNAARLFHALGGFSRLIRFDKRGTGLSDRGVGIPHLDERIDDIRAVLDAAKSERAFLFGISEGGPMAMLFAATYPERVAGLILFGTYACAIGASVPQDDLAAAEREVRENWGTGRSLSGFAPSAAGSPAAVANFAKFERLSASPSDVINLLRMNSEIDVRAILPTIRVPTLVIHRRDDIRVRSQAGRELAATIPGARYVEMPGNDHVPGGADQDQIVEEIRQFMGASPAAVEVDRVLSTVLFTDIVDSTQRAADMGDSAWRGELDAHDAIVRAELARFGGREVNTTGDGFVAVFDVPTAAVRGALAIVRSAQAAGFSLRAGVHTGECERRGDDLAGLAVHIAARVAAHAGAQEVLVSRTVSDVVAGSGLVMQSRGEHALKGLDQRWELFAVQP